MGHFVSINIDSVIFEDLISLCSKQFVIFNQLACLPCPPPAWAPASQMGTRPGASPPPQHGSRTSHSAPGADPAFSWSPSWKVKTPEGTA